MKFGKEFSTHLEETLPEWRDKFLCYKPLKKLIKHYPASSSAAAAGDGGAAFLIPDPNQPRPVFDCTVNTSSSSAAAGGCSSAGGGGGGGDGGRPSPDLQDSFVRILSEEVEKFNDFYVDKEEEFVIRLQELKERIERVKEKSGRDGDFTSENEFSGEMMEIHRDLVSIHGEMVLLKNYSALNFAGLVKILKKYDKRTGGVLRLPFTQLALRQPFFTTEPLTGLVHDCEAKLELLFPSEAEVIESNQSAQDLSNPSESSTPKISPETSSTLGEENMEIYRSTLAAMRAIKGLQKASSTYNPLSFSALENKDDETVTAENSPNSSGYLQRKEEGDAEDPHSD